MTEGGAPASLDIPNDPDAIVRALVDISADQPVDYRTALIRRAYGLTPRDAGHAAVLAEALGNALRGLPGRDAVLAAVASYEQAVEAYRAIQDQPGIRRCALAAADLLFVTEPTLGEPPGDNFRRAIVLYRVAREQARPSGDSDWIRSTLSLGMAGIAFAQAMESTDVREAVEAANEVLKLPLSAENAEARGMAHRLLGLALQKAGRSKRAIDQALAEYELALEGLRSPRDRASVESDRGVAYMDRLVGDRSRNIELAIGCYERAQTGLAAAGLQSDWTLVEQNRGIAYIERLTGDPSSNADEGIEALNLAIAYWRETGQRWREAEANALLGHAFFVRVRGARGENVDRAIFRLREATRLETRTLAPGRWARRQFELGTAYSGRIIGNGSGNQRRALVHFRRALSVSGFESVLAQRAATWNGIGGVLLAAAETNPGIATEAVCALRKARAAYRDQPEKRGASTYGLALALLKESNGDVAAIPRVKRTLRDAVKDLRLSRASPWRVAALKELGDLYLREGSWKRAWNQYHEAMTLSDEQAAQGASTRGDLVFARRRRGLHASAAYCSLKLRHWDRALDELESGLARTTRDALAGEGSLEASQSGSLLRVLRRRERALERSVEQPEVEGEDRSDKRAELDRIRRELTLLLEQSTRMTSGTLKDRSTREIRSFNQTVVVPVITPVGSAVFVLPPSTESVNAKHVTWLELTQGGLEDMLFGGREVTGASAAFGWLPAYIKLRRGAETLTPDFSTAMERGCAQLWETFAAPLDQAMRRVGVRRGDPVTLIAAAGLGLLPLHAARDLSTHDDFGDLYCISYSPSLSFLLATKERSNVRSHARTTILAVVNPTNDLPFARAEAKLVTGRFSPDTVAMIEGDAATPESVRALVAGRTLVHFACHGSFAVSDVWSSGLTLAGGVKMRLADVVALDLSSARLVMLSACETGLSDSEIPDEAVGISVWLVRAGAAQVVTTLWSVDDVSTMLLADEFYRNLDAGATPAVALATAQRWLKSATAAALAAVFGTQVNLAYNSRAVSRLDAIQQQARFAAMAPRAAPYSHPYYWAPFVLTGA